MAFSSDTGMAECLVVIARRLRVDEKPNDLHTVLYPSSRRPQGSVLREVLMARLRHLTVVRSGRVEDGPYGGTLHSMIGEELVGLHDQPRPVPMDGENWHAVRVSDYSVAQTAYALISIQALAPRKYCAAPVELKVTALLAEVWRLGLVDRDTYHGLAIKPGPAPQRALLTKVLPSPTATYPVPVEPRCQK